MDPKLNRIDITGYIQYFDIETGYWSIVELTTNKKFRIIDIPDKLKVEKIKIAATIETIDDEVSIFMSGISAKLIKYKIIK